jgi:hypothetical protein
MEVIAEGFMNQMMMEVLDKQFCLLELFRVVLMPIIVCKESNGC